MDLYSFLMPFKTTATSCLLWMCFAVHGQPVQSKLAGTYADGSTELTLYADNTFHINWPDPVLSYTGARFSSNGVWIATGHTVLLNPGKEKRKPDIQFKERATDADSIRIKIDYWTEEYENELPQGKKPAVFDILTVSLGKKQYYHLVHKRKISHCLWEPVIKKQVIVDASNVLVLTSQEIDHISIYACGFDKPVKWKPADAHANDFEVTIVQPLDRDRRPRGKKVIIKGKYAFFYENGKGRIPTSGFPFYPLKKMNLHSQY
jgi:hypothetical protein